MVSFRKSKGIFKHWTIRPNPSIYPKDIRGPFQECVENRPKNTDIPKLGSHSYPLGESFGSPPRRATLAGRAGGIQRTEEENGGGGGEVLGILATFMPGPQGLCTLTPGGGPGGEHRLLEGSRALPQARARWGGLPSRWSCPSTSLPWGDSTEACPDPGPGAPQTPWPTLTIFLRVKVIASGKKCSQDSEWWLLRAIPCSQSQILVQGKDDLLWDEGKVLLLLTLEVQPSLPPLKTEQPGRLTTAPGG